MFSLPLLPALIARHCFFNCGLYAAPAFSRRCTGKQGYTLFKLLKMDILEKLEIEFQPAFDARVRQIIAEQTPIYAAKYPFVGRITIGMGTVAVDDKDGIIMHEINWTDHDKRNPEGLDEIFVQIQVERSAASDDAFIVFLQQVQSSRFCSFCPDNIVFQ